jgi:hypothetical protein
MPRLFLRVLATSFVLPLAACGSTVSLHAPVIATSASRMAPVRIDLEPIVMGRGADGGISSGQARFTEPDPAAVLTSGMAAELAGRALHGTDAATFVVRCTLDRFALRTQSNLPGTRDYAVLYVDLTCEAERASDRAVVWRGALRARTAASGGNAFRRDTAMLQRLADRTVSDAARELASDLAVRALGLVSAPSARVFADETERASLGGIDDTPIGAAALIESAEKAASMLEALHDGDATIRAAAWNVIALAAGPGDPWPLGDVFTTDDDLLVRFFQYKALARQGSARQLAQLHAARLKEDEPLLAELADDAQATGGIGFARTNASAVTKGTTTSP